MKIEFLLVGKTTSKIFVEGMDDYVKRINHYLSFSCVVIPELKNTKKLTEAQQKTAEGELILKKIASDDYLVLLDEHGKELRSIEFATWMEKKQHNTRKLVFVVGGPYGFSDEVYQRCNEKISLSKMTFSHQMIRLIFTEQVYRACTIIKGEPYHHE
ncbi:MAG: 23S rRNA (pseudouridine(1915)-N(3))-methyltransferase RlmH [Prevotellaceae bacterium]|nr:23S rRNA (pseudouridine(1915)-N(3))-methyltransferase RlmH [Prevotellaceae bacterium]MDY3366020.1 23S rRNA (pseudouridine(1915)-N(3))-methyltransferase RlmH [Prevotella sp.]